MSRKLVRILVVLVILDILSALVAWGLMSSAKNKFESMPEYNLSSYEKPQVTDAENAYSLTREFFKEHDKLLAESDMEYNDVYIAFHRGTSPEFLSSSDFKRKVAFADNLESSYPKLLQIAGMKYNISPEIIERYDNWINWETSWLNFKKISNYLYLRAIVAACRNDEPKVIDSLKTFQTVLSNLERRPCSSLQFDISCGVKRTLLHQLCIIHALLGDNFHIQQYEFLFRKTSPVRSEEIINLETSSLVDEMHVIETFIQRDSEEENKIVWSTTLLHVLVPATFFYRRYNCYQYAMRTKEYLAMDWEELVEGFERDFPSDGSEGRCENPWEFCAYYWRKGDVINTYSFRELNLFYAAMKYKKEHNEFPNSIDLLAAEVGEENIKDSRTGKKYRIEQSEGKFVVYNQPGFRGDEEVKEEEILTILPPLEVQNAARKE